MNTSFVPQGGERPEPRPRVRASLRNPSYAALWYIGVVLILAGVFLGWMEVTYTFTDGTSSTMSYSGWNLYTEFYGSAVPIETTIPLLFLAIGVLAAFWGYAVATRRGDAVAMSSAFMLAMLAIMIIMGDKCFTPQLYANVSGNIIVGAVPDWLSALVSGDVYTARISSGQGYLASMLGAALCVVASTLCEYEDRKAAGQPEPPEQAA